MIRASDSTTAKHTHPCHGYDAALGDICMKLEHKSKVANKSFDDIISWITFHRDDPLFERMAHIATKYDHTMDEVIDRICMIHNDWNDA